MNQSSTNMEDPLQPASSPAVTSFLSVGLLVMIDLHFRWIFNQAGIDTFPHALVACCIMITTMMVCGERLTRLLRPGADILSHWLPVLFCPILITLPLADGVGPFPEFLKIGLVVVGGFFFTLFTTAGSIFAIRHILNDPEDSDDDHDDDDDNDDDHGDDNVLLCEIKGESSASNEGESSSREQQPRHEIIRPQKSNTFFSKELLFGLQELLLFSGIAMLMTYKLFPNAAALSGILESLFMLLVTLHNYAVGSRLVTCITTSTQWMHPLVTCTILTWVVVAIIVAPAKEQSSFLDILRSYHRNHGDMGLGGGAGDLLLYMLGPMVISLSVPMYSKRNIVRAHVKEVATAVISASFGSLFGTALVVRYLGVNTSHRLSLISRIVTPSLAIDISNILNTNVSIAVSVVVITGLIGSTFGVAVLDFLRIQDPIVRGLCMGVSAHGLGTGSLVHEQDAFPFAAIAMALTAFLSTVIVSIPFFQQLLLKTTLGG